MSFSRIFIFENQQLARRIIKNNDQNIGQQLPKAAATFEKAAKKADNAVLTPNYLLQAGLIYEAMEQPAKALKLYKQIKAEYPGSQEGGSIDQYIIRVSK